MTGRSSVFNIIPRNNSKKYIYLKNISKTGPLILIYRPTYFITQEIKILTALRYKHYTHQGIYYLSHLIMEALDTNSLTGISFEINIADNNATNYMLITACCGMVLVLA